MQKKSSAHNGIRDADDGSNLEESSMSATAWKTMALHLAPSRVLFSHLALGFCFSPQMVLNGKNKVTGSEHVCNATNLLQADKKGFISAVPALMKCSYQTFAQFSPPALLPLSQLLSLASNTPDHHTGNPELHPLESSGTKEPRASLFNHFRLKKGTERKDFAEAVEDGKSEIHPGQR